MSFKHGVCGLLVLMLAGVLLTGCGEKPAKPGTAEAPKKAETKAPAPAKGVPAVPEKTRDFELGDGGRTLLKYRGNAEEFVVPAGVTAIGDKAFAESKNLIRVTLPEGLVTIGEGAFANCQNLRDVNIPSTVTTIGKEAFWWCSNLTTVSIPPSVKTIGDNAFAKCGLMNLTLQEGLVTIGAKAFAGCTSLSTVAVPSTLNSIGEGAFNECPCEAWVKERFAAYKR